MAKKKTRTAKKRPRKPGEWTEGQIAAAESISSLLRELASELRWGNVRRKKEAMFGVQNRLGDIWEKVVQLPPWLPLAQEIYGVMGRCVDETIDLEVGTVLTNDDGQSHKDRLVRGIDQFISRNTPILRELGYRLAYCVDMGRKTEEKTIGKKRGRKKSRNKFIEMSRINDLIGEGYEKPEHIVGKLRERYEMFDITARQVSQRLTSIKAGELESAREEIHQG